MCEPKPKFIVCPDCHGEGRVMNESMRHHAYTQEEIAESGGDEFLEEMSSGVYDVVCRTCRGERVVNREEWEAAAEERADEEEARREQEMEYLMLGGR